MGDFEDWDRRWDDDYPEYGANDCDYYTRLADRGVWIAQTGQEHKISEMDDRHLRNSIALIRRGGAPTRAGCLPHLLREQERRTGTRMDDRHYVLCPGWVMSNSDGDLHYVGTLRLAQLYGVSLNQCRRFDPTIQYSEGVIFLRPRSNGDYRL